jgi:16S rRNA (guanine527-N7)-methyltransferase
MPPKQHDRPSSHRRGTAAYGPDDLRDLFARHGIEATDLQIDQFWRFHQLLRRENERLDLTRLHSFHSLVVRHYIDCALVPALLDLPSPLLDLGTGAGFPGIPLKIMRPRLELLLSEGRAKRVAFLTMACRHLGLANVHVVPHRITPRFVRPVAGVICRAVGSIPAILARTRGCLIPGGLAIFMKGPRLAAELSASPLPPDFELDRVTEYAIPGTRHQRALACFRRKSSMRKVIAIESGQNDRVKRLRSLLAARGIKKEGRALFAGRKVVPETIARHGERIEECVVRGEDPPPDGLPESVPVLALKSALFDELDVSGTGGPILVARVPSIPPWDPEATTGLSILVGFQDPVNVGAAVRLAVAFGAEAVVLLAEAAHPFLPRSVRAAGPAVLDAPFRQGPSIAQIAAGSLPLIALAPDGMPLPTFTFPRRCALAAGLEGPGLPATLPPHARVAIATAPAVASINAATALAIALYGYRLEHPL